MYGIIFKECAKKRMLNTYAVTRSENHFHHVVFYFFMRSQLSRENQF
jgi:hypothetical protein